MKSRARRVSCSETASRADLAGGGCSSPPAPS
eukprot:CAMPEP_0204173420 /NCGR_PEP_ID=MMETSP0361-20130328/44985_1 /ASSEMBLY_ACC=CAM_ASM_000343 /TAXON_ID=268821 /ORGANISM="Scrippsiella Hangoei, Strain SHTV-5" /LENGTH=31 /DNA_ID= /DNA_START= /DNA_END= /DNA_ORIENTATION=